MKINDDVMKALQKNLDYDDEQMKLFLDNKRNLEVLQKVPDLMKTNLYFKVVQAHGCACGHREGQVIKISANGSIDTTECPKRVCVYLMQAISPVLYAAQEFVYAGLDPSDIRFRTVGCMDTGITCDGFGHVAVNMTSRREE